MAATTKPPAQQTGPPRAYTRAVADLSAVLTTNRSHPSGGLGRPELHVEEMPAPQRIAPYSAAITADVMVSGDDIGTGRLVLLHDPAGNPAWDGTFRLVTFTRAEVDPEMVTDPLLASVGWSWLIEALDEHDADYTAPSGTVTAVASESFGDMARVDDPADQAEPSGQRQAEVEIRASWTPILDTDGSGLATHLTAWGDLLCTVAGLPPLPDGVVPMMPRRGGNRTR